MMSMMRRVVSGVCLVGACIVPVGTALAEPALTLKALPPKVQRTARAESKGAIIRSIVKEIEDGKTVYELAMRVDGHTRDIIIDQDGTVLIAEDQVTLASLAPAIRSTFVKSAGKGKIIRIESVTKVGVLSFYEAQVRTGGKISEIQVGLDGRLVPTP